MESGISEKETKFECEVCNMTFPTKEEYEKHMHNEHNK